MMRTFGVQREYASPDEPGGQPAPVTLLVSWASCERLPNVQPSQVLVSEMLAE